MQRVASHRLGHLTLHVVSDGVYFQDAGAVFGVVPRVMWEPYAGALDDRHRMSLGLNCLYLESQGKRILIETGVGQKERVRGASSPLQEGNLLAALATLGVSPEDIDIVINTHLHADHCGWNTRRADGERWVPTFPRAAYLIQRGEWEAATHPNERTRATYLPENLFPLEEAGVLELVEGERRVTDEVTIIPTQGHTADHASVVITSGGETAIYIGDMVQTRVQLERTAWVSAFDILPLVSMETKKRIVEEAIERRALIVAVHCPFPGLGRMTRTDDGKRRWVDVTPSASGPASEASAGTR